MTSPRVPKKVVYEAFKSEVEVLKILNFTLKSFEKSFKDIPEELQRQTMVKIYKNTRRIVTSASLKTIYALLEPWINEQGDTKLKANLKRVKRKTKSTLSVDYKESLYDEF